MNTNIKIYAKSKNRANGIQITLIASSTMSIGVAINVRRPYTKLFHVYFLIFLETDENIFSKYSSISEPNMKSPIISSKRNQAKNDTTPPSNWPLISDCLKITSPVVAASKSVSFSLLS
jgi:hypothetical protein